MNRIFLWIEEGVDGGLLAQILEGVHRCGWR
jgi:hypothetical protein